MPNVVSERNNFYFQQYFPSQTIQPEMIYKLLRFPFDWKTTFGFMGAMAIQYLMFLCGMRIGACALILAAGSYLHGIAISKCIKGSLFAINRNAKSKANRSHLLEQIIEFLQLHSNTQQLS